ncbi:Atp-dependent zinc metalloprotease ftsh protein, partial [Thalictrum thalictroides]
MASTSNTLVSSSFLGTNLHLSPPTPKTSNSNLLLLSLSKRKSQTTIKSILNNTNSFYLKNLPSQAALAAVIFSSISQTTLSALAIDTPPPPPQQQVIEAEAIQSSSPFSQNLNLTAPKPQSQSTSDLPDGTQWRYSEFLNAVKKGKVERVRFSKDGGVLQLSAVDGRRASVIVPNDPDLIDILAMNGVDISVSEGETGNGLFNFIGNLLFPVLAFAGLFFLFRRQGGPGGPGGLGGPMDFGRSKSKFQEVPETGVTFADVA